MSSSVRPPTAARGRHPGWPAWTDRLTRHLTATRVATAAAVVLAASSVASNVTACSGHAAAAGKKKTRMTAPHGGGAADAPKVPVAVPTPAKPGTPTTVVLAVDVTGSVGGSFVRRSLEAFAAAVPRLVRNGGGPVSIYVREINSAPGEDSAAVATYHIPAVPLCEENPFDQKCRNHNGAAMAAARSAAVRIGRSIRMLRLRITWTGTVIRGAFAAAGALLAVPGDRWLLVASDLVPSHSNPPRPRITLNGVAVQVLFACHDPIARCQARQLSWTSELKHDGALSVSYFSPQQSALLFNEQIGAN